MTFGTLEGGLIPPFTHSKALGSVSVVSTMTSLLTRSSTSGLHPRGALSEAR
jgi:hypothetical protein